MTSEKKLAIQQKTINELEEQNKLLTERNKELTDKCAQLENSFADFQNELSKARDLQREFKKAIAEARTAKKEYNNKMSVLIKRLKRQSK